MNQTLESHIAALQVNSRRDLKNYLLQDRLEYLKHNSFASLMQQESILWTLSSKYNYPREELRQELLLCLTNY